MTVNFFFRVVHDMRGTQNIVVDIEGLRTDFKKYARNTGEDPKYLPDFDSMDVVGVLFELREMQKILMNAHEKKTTVYIVAKGTQKTPSYSKVKCVFPTPEAPPVSVVFVYICQPFTRSTIYSPEGDRLPRRLCWRDNVDARAADRRHAYCQPDDLIIQYILLFLLKTSSSGDSAPVVISNNRAAYELFCNEQQKGREFLDQDKTRMPSFLMGIWTAPAQGEFIRREDIMLLETESIKAIFDRTDALFRRHNRHGASCKLRMLNPFSKIEPVIALDEIRRFFRGNQNREQRGRRRVQTIDLEREYEQYGERNSRGGESRRWRSPPGGSQVDSS